MAKKKIINLFSFTVITLILISNLFSQHFNVEIDDTGESTLFIFQDEIQGLSNGDEVGLFDAEGVIDDSGNLGELLVGAGVWTGSQLEVVAIGAVDLSQFNGPILPGANSGNTMMLKVWKSDENLEYDANYTIYQGTGTFNGLFTAINEISLNTINPSHFNVEIDDTGESTLFIFQDNIQGLESGDELGLFDANGIVDDDGNTGEILVGTEVWDGEQLEITAIVAVDLSQFNGPILPGANSGNTMMLKVWKDSEEVEYDVSYSISQGSGTFDGLFTAINSISFAPPCEDDDSGVAPFTCASAVATFGCDFLWGGVLISELCPETCDECGDDCASGFYDCSGVCDGDAVEDCAGECGGDAVVDECGECDGDGIDDGACDCFGNVEDCAGECGGDAVVDECGECGGDGIDDGACDCFGNVEDCAGECGGDAVVDECGECGGDGIDDGACDCFGNVEDCAGECGGDAVVDECGECGGDGADIMCDNGSYVCNESDCPDTGGWNGDACTMPDMTFHLDNNGSVLYNSSEDIAGFQFNVDGAIVNNASGGDAAANGFVVSVGGNTVLGFSFSGAVVPTGCGTLTNLSLNGDATGLSGIVVSSATGTGLDFSYYEGGDVEDIEGCTDSNACNYDLEATVDDGSCTYAEENYDCDGNCTAEVDCAGDCGGSAEIDECGVCNGDGIADGDCDCDGNVEDCAGECAGDAVVDECGECGGDGPMDGYDCYGECLSDFDGDGVCDFEDFDDDNDGALDDVDSNPYDPFICSDNDNDSCDDCSTGAFDVGNDGWDYDSDGACDAGDPDDG